MSPANPKRYSTQSKMIQFSENMKYYINNHPILRLKTNPVMADFCGGQSWFYLSPFRVLPTPLIYHYLLLYKVTTTSVNSHKRQY